MARKLRQVVDLYTTGAVTVLRDGTPVWVQPLNPFEADTARNEAQIAKTRMSLAIREFGSEEQERVRMYFFTDGLDGARQRLVEAKVTERTPRIFEAIRNDPEWTERLQIIDRGAEMTADPLEEEEKQLLLKITNEYALDLGKRIEDERKFQTEVYNGYDEDALWSEYLQWFIDRRAGERMMSEFRMHQVLYGVRWCEGVLDGDKWDHSACNGHTEPVFASKEEIRNSPEALLDVLFAACDDVDMSARDAKNSDRQESSYDSSPLPSGEAESTASTPTETRVVLPGSSSSPSPTPSPSSAGTS